MNRESPTTLGLVGYHRVSLLEVFTLLSSSSFSNSMLIFVLAFIAAQTAAAGLSESRIFHGNTFPHFCGEYISHVVQRDHCYVNKLYRVRDRSSALVVSWAARGAEETPLESLAPVIWAVVAV